MTISKQTLALLDQLVGAGLFGSTREEVMERLLCRQLETMLSTRHWALVAPLPADGPRCPECGSPCSSHLGLRL